MAIEIDRYIAPSVHAADPPQYGIRPNSWDDYIGQDVVKEQMRVFIYSARLRQVVLDHVLVYGPPGLGKTTMAGIIAHEMGAHFKQSSGPILERPGDLAAILTNLSHGDVLFIDEIHRLPVSVEEILYPALEDFQLDLMVGEGSSARSLKIDLPRFTLVGATTRAGLLSAPLRDRFGIAQRLDLYDIVSLSRILHRANAILGEADLTQEASVAIAMRARGTPRIANRLLRRVRDYAFHQGTMGISSDLAEYAMDAMHIDKLGLDELDRRFLHILHHHFHGGPTGIESLAATLGEDRGTLEDMVEPYLIQVGLLVRTPRGRLMTDKALEHLALSRK